MSFGWTAATWAAIASAAVTAYSTDQSRKVGNSAQDQAKRQAESQQLAADEANNKANGKTPDVGALLSANLLASKNGQAGTLLTGPGGVDPASLKLGKASLLGGG